MKLNYQKPVKKFWITVMRSREKKTEKSTESRSFPIVTGLLSFVGAIVGSCAAGYYEIKSLEIQNAYKFIAQYSKNMQIIMECREHLITSIRNFSEQSSKKIDYYNVEKINQTFYKCNNSANNLIFLSRANKANYFGLECYSKQLNSTKSKFDEVIHNFVGKPIPIYEIDPLIANQNMKWDSCLKLIQEDFEKFSNNKF
jgi:hypothetical protein